MATKKEKEQLMATLKFTPRTYRISMWGYGGEKVMGRVARECWDYCLENQVNLSDIAWSDEETVTEDMGLDISKLPFDPGQWYECDGLAHVNGVSKDAGSFQIEDENGNTIVEKQFDDCDGCSDDSPQWECRDEVWVGMCKEGEVVFIGSSNEKGTFFEGEIELREPFDITKLTLVYDDVDGESIISTVMYDGEEIDNYGGGTDGKSSDFNMVLLTSDDGEFERYEPEDRDYGEPAFGPSPDDWERSPKFKFKKHKPVHPGYYSVNWGYGSTFGSLYWNGENFGEWQYGKFHPINQEGVETWQGYNWDTSSWANQPPEPPNLICSNKKCGWVGASEDRIEDDKYNDHCPECNGTEFDWIDYDPDTKEGRANRAKYCKPWDPAVALEKIPVPNDTDKELVLDDEDEPLLADYECVQCEWNGTADEASYDDDDNMICPECGEPIELINTNFDTRPWINKKVKPETTGEYEVLINAPWPLGGPSTAEWNGKVWMKDGDKVKINSWR